LIRDLVEGQYRHPIRIVAFNTAEGWSRDVTVDVADELRRRYVELALQLLFAMSSESMGHHDSGHGDWWRVS
jgi:hypothetical protein